MDDYQSIHFDDFIVVSDKKALNKYFN